MKLNKFINIENIFIYLASFILSLSNISNLCRRYISINFDTQAFINWQYASSSGLIPYRDIYYPYGILYYFKSSSLLFSVIFILLTPFLLSFFYLIFKKISNNRIISLLSIAALIIFISVYSGFEVFNRYGSFLLVAQLNVFLFYPKLKNNFYFLFLGGFTALYFSVFNDLGIYSVIAFILFSLYCLFSTPLNKKNIARYLQIGAHFIIGFIVGCLPLVILAHNLNFTNEFINFLKSLQENVLFAKTPFFHSALTKENLFVAIILVISVCVVFFRLIKKDASSLGNRVLVASVIVLVLLEQKNIIRSMDVELTFVAFFILILLLIEILKYLPTKLSIKYYYFIFAFILGSVFFIGLRQADIYSDREINIAKIKQTLITVKDKKCTLESNYLPSEAKSWIEESRKIKEITKNEDFFIYPDEKIFYNLLRIKPYYYPSIYESSSENAQIKTIEELKKRNNQFIIYNSSNFSVQDEVPNYIRAKELHKYILENYSFEKNVDNFIVLKKKNKDLFKSFENFPIYFQKYLLNVNLENIPYSEGSHKEKYIFNNGNILDSGNLNNINEYLKINETTSKSLFIVIKFEANSKNYSKIFLKSESFSTQIIFRKCNKSVCVINISNIPLFAKNRTLESININDSDLKNIYLIRINGKDKLW